MSSTKRVWIDLPSRLEARLRQTTDRLGISRSEALRRAVDEFVKRYERHEHLTPREVNQGDSDLLASCCEVVA